MLAYCSPSLPHNNNPSPDRTALGLSIYYEIQDRGEGSSRFITILHRGFFKVYYNITDLLGILKGFDHFKYYICFYVVHFVSKGLTLVQALRSRVGAKG